MRIALALKGLEYHYESVHLARGAHLQSDYAERSADGLVPMLEIDGLRLSQSMAIIEYLEERNPEPPLLPREPAARARVRALAQTVACDIHPLNNLRVLKYLKQELKVDEEQKTAWYHHWVRIGLEAFENHLALAPAGTHCHGETPTLADCCLVPQIVNAERFAVPLHGLPRTMAVYEACMRLPAFAQTHPSACPDFEP